MMVRKPAPRVRALLELFRPLVDEIVLAADRTGDAATLEESADLADKRFELDPAPLNRRLGWLQAQCDCDWILRFDDDEVPSAAMLGSLHDLISDRQPLAIALKRRWLFGSPEAWISSDPWWPDFQIRLVRNAPGAWRFPGLMHAPIEILGDLRLVEAPLYHVELLLAGPEERRAKRERYDRMRPGLLRGDFPVNWYYTPEERDGVETTPTPPEDVKLIQLVERGSARPPRTRARSPVSAVSAWEAERFIESREVSPEAYRAAIELVSPPRRLPAGLVLEHELVVRNLGDEAWPAGDAQPRFRVGYRWLNGAGTLDFEGRCLFTERVRPGEATRLLARIQPPARPGSYVLELDVVHEHVRWFGCAASYEIVVDGSGAQTNGGRRFLSLRPRAAH